MSWEPLLITLISCVFGTAVLFRIISAVETVQITIATGMDPRNDGEAARAAAEQVRKSKQ